jgi:hypothetical protein
MSVPNAKTAYLLFLTPRHLGIIKFRCFSWCSTIPSENNHVNDMNVPGLGS